jgi:DNA-binding MarR family transcriptional regulator
MARRQGGDERAAAEIWKALYDFARLGYDRHLAYAGELGITPGDLKALMWLTPDQPQPMRALAERWGSDASTVTWVVDRLEQNGLVQRQPHPTDRRIRTVVLTEKGERTRDELLARLYAPPEAFGELTPAELRVLGKLVARLGP